MELKTFFPNITRKTAANKVNKQFSTNLRFLVVASVVAKEASISARPGIRDWNLPSKSVFPFFTGLKNVRCLLYAQQTQQ